MAGISLCFVGCGAMNARHVRMFKRLRPGSAFAVASRAPEKARSFWRVAGRQGLLRQLRRGAGLRVRRPGDRDAAARTRRADRGGAGRRQAPPDRKAGGRPLRRARTALAGAEASRRDGDGRREPALRPLPPAAERAAARPRPGTAADPRLDPARAIAPHRLAGRCRRDAAGRAARGGRPLDPAAPGPGVGLRAEPGRPDRGRLGDGSRASGHDDARRGHDDDRGAPPLGAHVAPAAHVGRAVAFPAVRRVQGAAGERRAVLRRAQPVRPRLRPHRPPLALADDPRRRRLSRDVDRLPVRRRDRAALPPWRWRTSSPTSRTWTRRTARRPAAGPKSRSAPRRSGEPVIRRRAATWRRRPAAGP